MAEQNGRSSTAPQSLAQSERNQATAVGTSGYYTQHSALIHDKSPESQNPILMAWQKEL